MDRDELSLLAHGRHPIACPFGDRKVDRLIEQLEPAGAAGLLDVGCGQGEWLARVLSAHSGIRGVAIDRSARSLAAARDRIALLGSRIELHQVDASTYVQDCSDPFDIILCAGSPCLAR